VSATTGTRTTSSRASSAGDGPSVAVVAAPLTANELAEIDRAFEALSMRRVLTNAELLAVCSTCEAIAAAAMRDELGQYLAARARP
jgi:hypothetical protein